MKKAYNIAITAVLAALIFGFGLAHLLIGDADYSQAERRKLDKLPAITASAVFNRSYSSRLESYLLDQFPLRDALRSIKAYFSYDVLQKQDNNELYRVDGALYKLDYPLDEDQAQYAVDRLNTVVGQYAAGSSVYYSVIPDKNYFVAEQNGYPAMDYERLLEIAGGINAEYIDIFPYLALNDYYRTDAHWRQERILDAANALILGMGAEPADTEYVQHVLYPFNGVYLGQSALGVEPDELIYLTNEYTDSASVVSAELTGTLPVYDEARFYGTDGYDVYLHGAQAVVSITARSAKSGRELIIFRDSYGSSIAPLFLGAYDTLTLVDLRYISPAILGEYVDFHGQDVLVLYSASLMNSGRLLK